MDDRAGRGPSALRQLLTALCARDLAGPAADRALAVHAVHGLEPGGCRAQVTVNESRRLAADPWCFEEGDVFALPADT